MIYSWASDLPEAAAWGWTLEVGPLCIDLWREVDEGWCHGALNLDIMIRRRYLSAFFGRWYVGYAYFVGERRGHGVVKPWRWAHG